jgi:hypothetical protein
MDGRFPNCNVIEEKSAPQSTPLLPCNPCGFISEAGKQAVESVLNLKMCQGAMC